MQKFICALLLLLATSGAQSATQVAPAAGTTSPTTVNPATSMSAPVTPVPAPTSAPATGTSAPTALQTPPPPSTQFDYSVNLKSEAFGAQLFTGSFARQGAAPFNPDYAIAVGDQIQIRIWGGLDYDTIVMVDPQGNVFLPQVGPVRVLGVPNQKLQRVIETAMRKVFRSNVYVYASLAAAQPVRVFVGGYVNRPGLYNGTSLDSLLFYLDQAGGIDAERGTFLDVQVKRGELTRASMSLYNFLLEGRIPLIQLADGDVIFIPARQNTVKVTGLAENTRRFEFKSPALSIAQLTQLAKPSAQATHVRVVRNTGTVKNVEYYALADSTPIAVGNGDEVEFTADKKPGTITVRVEGEHLSPQEYVLPYGARFGDVMKKIEFSERSDTKSIRLTRVSVRERQKAMLNTALQSLESTILTARSGTSDEARLRSDEAGLILQWVDRAKKIEPSGQVYIAQNKRREELTLENGDIINVPALDGLVLVSGEVLFPNAIAHDPKLSLDDYIRRAGGYTQNADNSRIVVAHRDGSFDRADENESDALRSGDEVLVLPKVDVKSRQIFKEMTEIIYQIAISAKVVLGL